MGTGQMLLTIGAIILLGNIMITTNRAISKSNEILLETGYQISSISIATSIIERAQGLAFDDNTDTTSINSLTPLTPTPLLGIDSYTDTTSGYDDYDDFNKRTEIDTLWSGGKIYAIFKDSTAVHYVARNRITGLMDSSYAPTWSKQLDVWVWKYEPNARKDIRVQDSIGSCVHMFDIFSYWF
jgi:hypothetical protein